MQQLLHVVGQVPDDQAFSDKDFKMKQYFDTCSALNRARYHHEGKQMAMKQILPNLPNKADMGSFDNYIKVSQIALEKIAPGRPNPFLPIVMNMKTKINDCSRFEYFQGDYLE